MSEQTKKKIIIIDNHKYDVTRYKHPGDGICNIYLADFANEKGKEASEEFEHYHYTDKPFALLERAKKKGQCAGIIYLGPITASNNNEEDSEKTAN